MENVNIKHSLIVIVLMLSLSCQEKGILFEYPNSLLLKKKSEIVFSIKIKNNTQETFIIDNVGTSCNCLVVRQKFPLKIKTGHLDSIKIKFLANQEKKGTETLIITHNLKGRFKKPQIRNQLKQ
jgi:hypothetical protein